MRGFFRYHGLWAPGVRLFRAIGFRAKALVISAVFALPLLQLGWQYFGNASAQIGNTRMELAGVAILKEFVPVFRGILETRSAGRARLAGYEPATAQYADARQRTDQALLKLQAAIEHGGDPLEVKPVFSKLQDAWSAGAGVKEGFDEKSQLSFDGVNDAALDLLNDIGDKSQLVLDPDLDSFYMVNALVLTLPKTMNDLAQLWSWGVYATVKASIGSENEARWHVWSARVETGGRRCQGLRRPRGGGQSRSQGPTGHLAYGRRHSAAQGRQLRSF
jgi:hypothetical protein